MEKDEVTDDPTISDSEGLWRRIHPIWAVPDKTLGKVRVSSAAFDDSADGSPLSVLIERLVKESGRTVDDVMDSYDGYFLASINSGDARQLGLGIEHTPTTEEPAHGSVHGKKTKSVKSKLAKRAQWVVAPSHR